MLKILTPVPVPYTAVLAIISSTTFLFFRTEKHQGKRIGNEDPHLPKTTTITTSHAWFSASKEAKVMIWQKEKVPRKSEAMR